MVHLALVASAVLFGGSTQTPTTHWTDFETGQRRPLAQEMRLSLIILGDGFRIDERGYFNERAADFERRLFAMEPYKSTRGAWQVLKVFSPSQATVSSEGQGYFGIVSNTAVPNKPLSTTVSPETARRIHQAIRASQANPGKFERTYERTWVLMLINTGRSGASGFCTLVTDPDTGDKTYVAFGDSDVHEFNHAFARLRDEYIHESGVDVRAKEEPTPTSIWHMSNLIRSRKASEVPWKFLLPGTELNPEPRSVIGRLWEGGFEELGVYRAEPACLMNGTHMNWTLNRTERRANLRNNSRLCFWCEDIVAARIAAHAGVIPAADAREQWKRWEALRPAYQKSSGLKARIAVANREYASYGIYGSPLMHDVEK